MAESASKTLPLREKEKGDPGRKELFLSPMTFSEGCSLICWRAVTGEREARSLFMLLALLLEVEAAVEGVEVVDGGGVGMAAGAGDAAALDPVCRRELELELLDLRDELVVCRDEFFCWLSSGGGVSTSR